MPKKQWVSTRVLDRLASTSGNAVKVYAAMVRLGGRKLPTCEASFSEVSKEARVARSTTIACIQTLVGCGLLTVERRPEADGGFRSNVYRITMEV